MSKIKRPPTIRTPDYTKQHIWVYTAGLYRIIIHTVKPVERACPKNCVNDHSEVKYGHGTKEERERKGYYRSTA